MIYPGYAPQEGVEPILLHYGLRFSVGNWSFSKADHDDDDIVYNCGQLFPQPPYPREVWKKVFIARKLCLVKFQVHSFCDIRIELG